MVDPGDPRSRWPLRAVSLLVLAVFAALALVAGLVVRGVVHDQEHRLLQQRTEEASLVIDSALGNARGQLATVGGAVLTDPGDADAFRAAATALQRTSPQLLSLALVKEQPAPVVVQTVQGSFPGVPRHATPLGALTGQPAQAVAAAAKGNAALQVDPKASLQEQLGGVVATTPLRPLGPTAAVVGIAYAGPAAPPGYAVYEESYLPTPAQASRSTGDAFSEIDAVVYAAGRVDPAQLVLTTVPPSTLPLRGAVASQVVNGGPHSAADWLLQVKARGTLVGSVAAALPWVLTGGGLLLAVLAAAVVEVLARRRRYAMALVDERTAELRASLDELAAAQAQLVRSERLSAIGELASAIGHELRNPLGVLSNALYLLRGYVVDHPDERLRRQLDTADREVAASTLIISDLLEFARARDPIPSTFDLQALLDETLSVAPPPASVAVQRAGPDVPIDVDADRDQVRQVLLNLVSNAYQAMPDGGTLRVGARPVDGAVCVEVGDSGTGVPDDLRERVFEPFFTTKARGVGLGLAVSRRIIEAHGGSLEVRDGAGGGATFVVTLPRLARPRPAPATSREEVAR